MLYYFIPDDFGVLWFIMATVAIGEFVIVLIGVTAFADIEKINPKFVNMLKG